MTTERLQLFTNRLPNLLKLLPKRTAEFAMSSEVAIPTELGSFYLYGCSNTGKSVMAVKMLLHWSKECFIQRKRTDFLFFKSYDLFIQARKACHTSPTEEELFIKKLKDVSMLVIDDIFVEKTTAWNKEILYSIMDYRCEYNRPTIITSNYDLGELSEKFGDDRIPVRIKRLCGENIIQLTNKPY